MYIKVNATKQLTSVGVSVGKSVGRSVY